MLIKGLPLAYNRDLQEDKPRIFDSFDTVAATLDAAAPLVARTELNRPAINERLDRGHLDATTLMEEMMRRGIPQRTANELAGKLVREALDKNVRLSDLPSEDFANSHPSLEASIASVLGVENAIARFVSYGSTAPAEVEKQITAWEAKLKT